MNERIQKVLARAGVASRRQVEEWIRAGRVAVNGLPAVIGAQVGPRDKVTLDGRHVRLGEVECAARVVIYHRPPRVNLASADDPIAAKLFSQLPKRSGRRWIAVSPLPPNDSGLELLTSDGILAQALMRRFNELPVAFAVRVRGEPRLEQLDHLKSGVLPEGEPLRVESVELAGGVASNRWFDFTVIGGRARDLHRLFDGAGLQISRLMRVALGPIKMDRALARGRVHMLTPAEAEQLYSLAGVAMTEAPAPAAGRQASPSKRKPDRRTKHRRKSQSRPEVRSTSKPRVHSKSGKSRSAPDSQVRSRSKPKAKRGPVRAARGKRKRT